MYGEKLKEMERRAVKGSEDRSSIEFLSLWDLFFANPEVARLFPQDWVEKVEIPHILPTRRTEEAELSRKLLMGTCHIDPSVLRNLIKGQDESILALYRGFSRFMLEDLAVHPACIRKSVSQRKKLATKVAAEMIEVSRHGLFGSLLVLNLTVCLSRASVIKRTRTSSNCFFRHICGFQSMRKSNKLKNLGGDSSEKGR